MDQEIICAISNEKCTLDDAVIFGTIVSGFRKFIKKKHPKIKEKDYICKNVLREIRRQYIEDAILKEKGHITIIDKKVVDSILNQESVVRDSEREFIEGTGFWDGFADKVAEFVGSWKFIFIFCFFIVVWIILNAYILLYQPLDPYPFILLNLVLSCVAALQAPIIIMSQNRKEEKDRIRSQNDYMVNLKAELEIKGLNEKIDYLLQDEWKKLLEVQRLQLDILEELSFNKK